MFKKLNGSFTFACFGFVAKENDNVTHQMMHYNYYFSQNNLLKGPLWISQFIKISDISNVILYINGFKMLRTADCTLAVMAEWDYN